MEQLTLEAPLRAGGGTRVPLEELMAYQQVPGASVAVIEDGAVAWASGHGVAEAGTTIPVGPETVFQCCSISKHVAMVGALRLVEEERLGLDDDVNDRLSSWRLPTDGAVVTVRQLLGHTAGLTYCWYRGFRRGAQTPTLLDVLEGRPPANTPPVRVVRQPGSGFRYSGSHYTLLQQVMVDVAGQPFPALMRRLVCEPLGMTRSSYDQAYPDERPELAARGHYDDGEVVRGGWRVIPEMAGAGLWTTAGDLARLAVELQRARAGRGRLLSKELVEAALTPGQDEGWGLGLRLGGEGAGRCFGHGGDNIGYKARTQAFLERGQGAVVLTNGDDGARVIDAVFDALGRRYGWPEQA
jgi:CubicO group peptidase (beta-lactamase class C family)